MEPNWKKAQEALSAGNADADAKNAELESKMSDLEDDLAKLRKELENAETDKTELQQQLFQVLFYFLYVLTPVKLVTKWWLLMTEFKDRKFLW